MHTRARAFRRVLKLNLMNEAYSSKNLNVSSLPGREDTQSQLPVNRYQLASSQHCFKNVNDSPLSWYTRPASVLHSGRPGNPHSIIQDPFPLPNNYTLVECGRSTEGRRPFQPFEALRGKAPKSVPQ